MNCRGLLLELSTYLDGDLDPQALVELQLHLDHCKKCRIIVDTTRKTIDIYCQTEPMPLPADVRERLHEALVKRLGRKSPS